MTKEEFIKLLRKSLEPLAIKDNMEQAITYMKENEDKKPFIMVIEEPSHIIYGVEKK